MVEAIEIPSPAGPIHAFSAAPQGGASRAVVVIQEAFGLTEHIGEVVDRLAAAGYRTIAPAVYHRQGAPVIEYESLQVAEKAEYLIEVMSALTASES